jgi:hypothetical protein
MEKSSTAQPSREAKDERKADKPREASRRRFRIVKLEERIAPSSGSSNPCTCSGHTTHTDLRA